MANIIIVYASMTGNTEEIAEAIAEGIREAGITPVLKSVMDVNASELLKYEGILLGAYTWGDGELPDEFLDFYEEMDDIHLSGHKAAVFGSADSSYTEYGAAVDILIHKLQEIGADNVMNGLKIELNPTDQEKEMCRAYGSRFAGLLVEVNAVD